MADCTELEKSKSIVRLLATGIDPVTKMHFASNSPYRHPEVVQALATVLKNCDLITIKTEYRLTNRGVIRRQIENLKNDSPINNGLGWNQELMNKLILMHRNGYDIEQLSLKFGRSVSSIVSILNHQELIEKNNDQKESSSVSSVVNVLNHQELIENNDNQNEIRAINHGKQWTQKLKAELTIKYSSGMDIEELCDVFGRSKRAIVSQLFKLGLISTGDVEYY